MRFLMLMYPGPHAETGKLDPSFAPAMEEMGRYNDELIKAGVLLEGEGLQPTSKGARVRFQGNGKTKVTDGPFTEAKEIIGGFWMIQVKSKDEAVEWARRAPCPEGEMIELRQVYEAADFPADLVSPELAAKEQAFRDAAAAKRK